MIRHTLLALVTFVSSVCTFAQDAPQVPYPPPVAQDQVGKQLNFVACPVIRDTNHPCWLAAYEGELYFLGVQGSTLSEFYPPQLRHKALIEGVISDAPRQCGGIVLQPVKVSTMRELDETCNTILPAEGYVVNTTERAPGPASAQQPRRREQEPEPTERVQREYVVGFDFDMLRAWIGEALEIGKAAQYAQAIDASRVVVMGYRGFAQLTNGEVLEELPELARQRAERVAFALKDIGIPESKIRVDHHAVAVGPEPGKRRVEIIVVP